VLKLLLVPGIHIADGHILISANRQGYVTKFPISELTVFIPKNTGGDGDEITER
jgi:hypothetical protein